MADESAKLVRRFNFAWKQHMRAMRRFLCCKICYYKLSYRKGNDAFGVTKCLRGRSTGLLIRVTNRPRPPGSCMQSKSDTLTVLRSGVIYQQPGATETGLRPDTTG